MANYSAIKAAVNGYIKANGRKEITGSILNAVLNATIDSLGRFFQFAGGAMPTDDPGTPDQNVCYLATEPGLYIHFNNIRINNEEVALLFWNGAWVKQTIAIGIQEVNASVDNQVGTPSVDVNYSQGQLVLTFHNLKGDKGNTGDPAGFGTIGADITGGVGTPGVSVESSGDNASKNLMFHFTNLKGETGVTSVIATIDNTSGTPSCRVSLVNGVLTLAFSGLKGLKGDTGVSADYPITIYNGLDSDATDQALSAAQGKILDERISQTRQDLTNELSVFTPLDLSGYVGKNIYPSGATYTKTSSTNRAIFIPVTPGKTYRFSASPYSYFGVLKTYNSPVNGDPVDYATGYTTNVQITGEIFLQIPADGHYLYVFSVLRVNNVVTNIDINLAESTFITERVDKLETDVDSLSEDILSLQGDRIQKTTGNNLFDWRNAKMGVVSASGEIQGSSSYWMTDYIQIDKSTLMVSGGTPFRVSLFDQNKSFLRTIAGTDLRTILDVSGASYVIVSFAITTIALDSADAIFVNYGCGSDVATTQTSIDGKKMSYKDPQFFTIADIINFASNSDEQQFTQGFSLVLRKGDCGNKNMIITSEAKFTSPGGGVPTIKVRYFYRGSYSVVYESQSFTIGNKDFFEEKQWRLPKFPEFCVLEISVDIPSGVSLFIKSFENSYDNGINRNCPAYIFDGHRNQNTLKGFERVAMLGFPSCITIPKRTSDGVWVCFHDEVIGSQLVDANGNSPGSVGIWDLTFAQLQTYTYKEDYAGNKAQVPTLEEFFLICARTGMRPMLSVHPTPTASEYQEIKDLAIRCGVLKQLELKPLVTGEGVAFATFGNEISAYILQANTISASSAISRLNALGADTTKVRVGAEFFGDSAGLTEQGVADIVAAGYVVSIYAPDFSADQYKYWMSKGVTEFTDDGNSSYGLNW
jgi:hypothetical protein